MKRIVAMLALTACAVLGAAQTQWVVVPNSFQLAGATTRQPLRTLFNEDGEGMTLTPFQRLGPVQEAGIELLGQCPEIRAYTMTFAIGDLVFAGANVARRVEFFNYTTNAWDVLLRTSGAGQDVAMLPQLNWTTVTVKTGGYVHPKTGQFKTRMFWTSSTTLGPVWVDQAGWILTEHWRG